MTYGFLCILCITNLNNSPTIIAVVALTLRLRLANLLIPMLVGSRANVDPVARDRRKFCSGWLWGTMGVLLAVPLTAFR
jgi:predicted PurR-regulated permease PerM